MIVSYLTDDDVVVSVCHVGLLKEGMAKWQVRVEGMGGVAQWGVPDLPASPRWSAERVARLALEWAQALPDADPCPCEDDDCPGKDPPPASQVFGPTPPCETALDGPYLSREDAIAAVMARHGHAPDDEREPSIEELVAELDGIDPPPEPPDDPPDPYRGSTWRLG